MDTVPRKTLSVFYSYAHEDSALHDALDKHLASLKRGGWIQSWSDRDIRAGQEWQNEVNSYLLKADIILLLISPDFIASDYRYSVEMHEALRRHQTGEAIVIPIHLRPVDWQDTPFSTLQALPLDGKPVTSWNDKDEAFAQIAQEIRRIVETMRRWVFVISSPQDQSFTTKLYQNLSGQGILFWNQGHHLLESTFPESTTVYQAMRNASTILLIVSPHMPDSHLVEEYLNLATFANQRVLAVWAAGEDWKQSVPEAWVKTEVIDARERRFEHACTELLARLRQPLPSSSLASPFSQEKGTPLSEPSRNPYKGLKPFTSKDTRYFFGRERLIERLVLSMQTMLLVEQNEYKASRLLAVVGPSGSGKSSVVMAGLLPRLQQGALPTSASWLYLDRLLPGAHPLEALALVLARTEMLGNAVLLQSQLESDSKRVLHLLASQLTPAPEAKVVLMIDQFEEIFTQTGSEQERRKFIDLLVTAVTEPNGSFMAFLTLRADFSDRPMLYPELSHLIEAHRVPVLPMDLQDLRAVIEEPARLPDICLTFEGNLVNDLLFEMKDQPRALPLLEFTLEQLFQRRRGHQITLQAHHEMGGVTGALSRHAEETYARLPSAEHRRLAHALFMRLINPGDIAQDATRRRALFSEFALSDPAKTLLMEQTIDVFTTARLLTVNEIGGAKMIELSHEALLGEWNRLADWIKEAYEDIRFQQRISRDVLEWKRLKNQRDRLYRGSVLKEAQRWEKRNTPSEKERAFLRASVIQGRKEYFLRLATVIVVVMVTIFSVSVSPIPNFVQLVLNGCALSSSNVVDGGSTAFFNTAQTEAAKYHTACPSGFISVTSSFSSNGLVNLESNDLQIANSELSIKEAGYYSYSNLQEHQVAVIVFTLIVNKHLEGITSLSPGQITGIYNGTITNWQSVGGPDRQINVIGRPNNSGTHAAFKRFVLDQNQPEEPVADVQSNSTDVTDAVSSDPGAIGYVDLTSATQASNAVTELEIDGNAPTVAQIENNSYRFWAIERMYTKQNEDALSLAFINYVMRDIQTNVGFIPIGDISKSVLDAHQ